jgi:hypothetical protein
VADWGDYAALAAADADGALSAEELERLAVAAFLLGRDGEVPTLRERAFEAYLARGLVERAAECGFWLGFHLDIRGDVAQAAGWAARVRRLIPDDDLDSRLGSRLRQLTSLDYRDPAQFEPGPVLVVGAANSGTDVALDAAAAGITRIGRIEQIRDGHPVPVRASCPR